MTLKLLFKHQSENPSIKDQEQSLLSRLWQSGQRVSPEVRGLAESSLNRPVRECLHLEHSFLLAVCENDEYIFEIKDASKQI